MMRKSFLPPFGKILLASILLTLLGGGGLAFIFIFFEPNLGPRWMFFFFLTIFGSGIALPVSYIIQRRFASQVVPGKVLIRESLLFGIFLSLLAWLQLGRVLSNLIIIIIAVGFLLLEMLLRMAEKAIFKAGDYGES
ncbi:MAG: hypothetical protein J7L66_05720 [Anaerolineaceae bacterium]|nr:hypothetical protein [Anaerolineaceae bacterium]